MSDTTKKEDKEAAAGEGVGEPEPKRRGRPPKELPAYEGPAFGLEASKVEQVSTARIDIEDTTFQFRVDLRAEALVDSIRSHGIQTPLVLRLPPGNTGYYQIVCGFRRATAAQMLRLSTVPAVVRDLDDQQAQILSYAENEQRKTFSDLDRAQAIAKLRASKKTTAQIAGLLRLGDRQVQRLEALLEYPEVLRRAVGDEDSGVTTTHALVLMQASRKPGAKLDVADWVKRIRKEKLSLDALRQALREEARPKRSQRKLVRRKGDIVSFNLKAVKKADEGERKQAISELEGILKKLKG
ncbi:MAG: ParB/RepB/Spo0J family partition protein [Deltaproteobacteria bacterium]|nr:ParB/RepB/Spo0J family partition protein [Deltaproteobacteria bacterium]